MHYIIERGLCSEQEISRSILPCLVGLYQKSPSQSNYLVATTIAIITGIPAIDCSSAVPILVQMLTAELLDGTSRGAAVALNNLCVDQRNCEAMLEHGALIPVVQLTQSEDKVTRMTCASILSTLSLHSHTQFRHAAVLSVLLKLSRMDHIPTQRRIVIALSNLSLKEDLRLLIIEQQPIPYINSLASKPDENIRRGCAAIACNLSFDAGSEAAFVKGDVVSCLLIIALVASDQLSTKITCVKALINLMGDSSLLPSMVKDSIVWGLSSLAIFGNDELLELCADALSYIAYYNARAVISSPASEKAANKILGHSEPRVVGKGITLIYSLLAKLDPKNPEDIKICTCLLNNAERLNASEDDDYDKFIKCLSLVSQVPECRKSLLQSPTMNELKMNVICQDVGMSYAYLIIILNIALDEGAVANIMSNETFRLLHSISRLVHSTHNLGYAIMKLLYCLSGHNDSLEWFDHDLIFETFRNALKSDHQKGALRFAVGFLYNLTTCVKKQHRLVSLGIAAEINRIWESIKESEVTCELAVIAICHLACGHVNTSRLIADNCGQILVYVTAFQDFSLKFANKTWERCAAAWRNLLSNISNQSQLVEIGALDSVIWLSRKAGSGLFGSEMIRNCTAALRSMTFNPDLRELLLTTSAIDIILANLEEGIVTARSSSRLEILKELETESWSNGSRGREKDGKAKYIPCGHIHTHFAESAVPMQIEVVSTAPKLGKYQVIAELDSAAYMNEVEMSRETFTYEIDSKSVFDTDEPNQLKVQPWGKQGCDESDNPLYFIRFVANGVMEPISVLSSPVKDRRASATIPSRRPSTTKSAAAVRLSTPILKDNLAQERILGSVLDEDVPAERPTSISKPIHVSRETKKIDELVATIRKAKRSKGDISTEDILKQYKSLSL